VSFAFLALGMRRKSFYIVEVDVYLTGLSLTKQLANTLKRNESVRNNPDRLVDVMLSPQSKSPAGPLCNICITLKFVRSVTAQQCVDAFTEAFKGCNAEGTAKFSKLLGDAVGAQGCKVGEEVNFYWLEKGGLYISRGGTDYFLSDPEIERRLLEVYVTPARTVSPELVKSFNEFLQEAA
jgi:hypothetical protein